VCSSDLWLDLFSGGRASLEWGGGAWLERMDGKALIYSVIAPGFCRVGNQLLQGPELAWRVARDLMERFDELDHRPADLVALRDFFAATAPSLHA
jgi:hypothetical protein